MLQIVSYFMALGTTAAVYGIVILNYSSAAVQLAVGLVYGIIFAALAVFGCRLTLDDPTEVNSIKTHYYRDVLG